MYEYEYEYEYAYEIAKILLALWGGLSLTYGSLVIGLVVRSRCAKLIGLGLKRISHVAV
jgi:hypothetical protein